MYLRGMQRSQRVILTVPVSVCGPRATGDPLAEVTTTIVVNARGALILLRTPVLVGEKFQLVNKLTGAEARCTVANIRPSERDAEKWEVGVSFDEPRPTYWGLAFPQKIGTR